MRALVPRGRLDDPRPHPPEYRAQLQRLLQVLQQGRGIRAVPTTRSIGRGRTRGGGIRHQRLVTQRLLVQLPETAPTYTSSRAGPSYGPRQRVVSARVQNRHPQCRPLGCRQHVVQRYGGEPHVGIPLQPRVHGHHIVDAVYLQAVTRVEHERYVRSDAPTREIQQGLVERNLVDIENRRHFESESSERRSHVGRVVARILQVSNRSIRAIAYDQRHPVGGLRRCARTAGEPEHHRQTDTGLQDTAPRPHTRASCRFGATEKPRRHPAFSATAVSFLGHHLVCPPPLNPHSPTDAYCRFCRSPTPLHRHAHVGASVLGEPP